MLKWSDVDYKRFGLKTAKLSVDNQNLDIRSVLSTFKKNNGQLFIIRCDTTLFKTLYQLQYEEGFFLTDSMLNFSISIHTNATSSVSKKKEYEIVSADKDYSDLLSKIATKAFAGYLGHYHNNPRLNNKRCDEVYVDWSKNLVLRDDMADAVLVCRYNDSIVGFASLKLKNEVAVAGLLCVDPAFEGEGIATTLHQKRFEWCKEKGIRNFQINTSINNQKYINLLINIGYKFRSASYILHLNNF